MKKWTFPEEFLHFVWRTKRFNLDGLRTTIGHPVQMLHFGQHNSDAGPDFLHARIHIDDTLWVGNVEIHIRASDWLVHQHHLDPAYDNVILHVVWEEDTPLQRANGERIPTLELEGRIAPSIWQVYQDLRYQTNWLACQFHFNEVESVVVQGWIERLMVERLEHKTQQLEPLLKDMQHDWETLLYQQIARGLGLVVNAEPMEQLARLAPIQLLWKYRDQPELVEAFLFGQAGMLERSFEDEYPRKLQDHYRFLQNKHRLTPMTGAAWKFSRLRPAAFPTVRIAQLAALVCHSPRWFSELIQSASEDTIRYFFQQLAPSWYWHVHYLFDKPAVPHPCQIGDDTIALITINALAPLTFLFGTLNGQSRYREQALALLERIPPESNRIIREWKGIGVQPASAGQSQALLHWRKTYCEPKRCLECAVGCAVLK
ncbi:MAG: DUF2851 family protein [Saprospirales bacterium]|nr:DUF2851 family protein [Saprospirales bacterium]MBK8491520.1 DUF2851 family protein [Saprospirales bacterium]